MTLKLTCELVSLQLQPVLFSVLLSLRDLDRLPSKTTRGNHQHVGKKNETMDMWMLSRQEGDRCVRDRWFNCEEENQTLLAQTSTWGSSSFFPSCRKKQWSWVFNQFDLAAQGDRAPAQKASLKSLWSSWLHQSPSCNASYLPFYHPIDQSVSSIKCIAMQIHSRGACRFFHSLKSIQFSWIAQQARKDSDGEDPEGKS